MKYPAAAKQLIDLLMADQEEVKNLARIYHDDPASTVYGRLEGAYRHNAKDRLTQMMTILQTIPAPTIENIGPEASEALAVIALHSSCGVMEKVLRQFEDIYQNEPQNVYYQVIPALTDRVLILQNQKQKFGTQWLRGENGEPFLYPIEDFAHINALRGAYGLGPLRYPRVVALAGETEDNASPVGKSAMREPTEREIQEYRKGFLE